MKNKEEFLREHPYLLEKEVSPSDFPPNFLFGVATSAYQIEGGCKEGGRGPNIRDAFSHTEGTILDGSNGDVAVDHYHCYKVNVSGIGYDGLGIKVNEEGISLYNNIINALLEKSIEPCITLYHWDLPLHLQESMGRWLNKEIVKYFASYGDTCFASFGDRVKNWITINKPLPTAVNGREQSDTEPYLAAHHQILANATAVSIYRSKYKDNQGGQVGLVVDCEWAEANSDKIEDKGAAAKHLEFQLGWCFCPIYYGDYPEVMHKIVGDRLPKFSEEDKELLWNSIDSVGLNHYTSRFINHVTDSPEESFYHKAQKIERLAEWEEGEPIGEKVLNYIARRYNNPKIYISENGMDDEDSNAPLHKMLDDKLRVRYFKGFLAAVAQAIKDEADVRGYFTWSLADNFEWVQGYTKRFGLNYMDYKNRLARQPESSAFWFMRFLKGGGREE
ncbi:hypothetical protein P3X46_011414 [Hevea brasiliensis]|uniref:Beta-glucosidase n=1 Tax=Hevea brasiliensis TaxID=3981 RepID=A0ABQ9MB19_HEVBR|nr:hypothetical protein P3X46_011414 [Hevea brasiliensis]